MTREEARIILLEDALEQAQSTVEFLHGCLTKDNHQYAYPEQTLRHLQEWSELVPRGPYCVHSFTAEGCESCSNRVNHMIRLSEAKDVLHA